MHKLTIINELPYGEHFTAYIDGKVCTGDAFEAPDKFMLRLEQYRVSSANNGDVSPVRKVLSAFSFGGRSQKGAAVSTPDKAVWEAECETDRDGELTVSLAINKEGQVLFNVASDSVKICEPKSERVAEPGDKRRWLGMMIPFAVISTVFLSVMFFSMLLTDTSSDTYPSHSSILLKVLSLIPALMIAFIWYKVIKVYRISGKPANDAEGRRARRYKIMTVVFYVESALFYAVATAILLLPLIWGINRIIVAAFPCVGLAVFTMILSGFIESIAEYETGGAKEAAQKLTKAKMQVFYALLTVFAALIALFVAKGGESDVLSF